MNNIDPDSNLARKLREAGINPDDIGAIPPEEKLVEVNKSVAVDDEQRHADAGQVSELQRENIENLRRQADGLTPLTALIARKRRESQPPLRDESPVNRS